jgi:hypothetical protein
VTLDSISFQERSAIALRQLFKQNRKSAEAIYDRHELTIDAQKQEHSAQIETFTKAAKAGTLSTEKYQKQLQQLLLTVKHPQFTLL